jgi:hypothetical protein
MANVVINGQQVPWSFIKLVYKAMGDDWDTTIDLFWKARNATGRNGIIRYVKAGFKPDKKGNRYAFLPSADRDAGRMRQIRDWWKREVYTPKNEPKSLGEILSGLVKQ